MIGQLSFLWFLLWIQPSVKTRYDAGYPVTIPLVPTREIPPGQIWFAVFSSSGAYLTGSEVLSATTLTSVIVKKRKEDREVTRKEIETVETKREVNFK